ncbi:MAG: PaaI family thioesterase [Deltaproteobacteria bacterium]
MIRPIENVFTDFPDYGCFACDPRNSLGLRMKFFADDERGEVFVRMKPEEHFSGFPGIVHGGVQCALMDEVGFWAMFDRLKKIGLTAKIDMELMSPVRTSSEILVRGRIDEVRGKKVFLSAEILDDGGRVCARSKIVYHVPKRRLALRLLGSERFSEKFLAYLED